jgi:hypothetical protein
MPLVIDHIDKIARVKKRDVLFVTFTGASDAPHTDWRDMQPRTDLIQWFQDNDIEVTPCAGMANVDSIASYEGMLYIDLPADESSLQYKLLCEHLENADGTMRHKEIFFYLLPLEAAMKNAHHDQPGFWQDEMEDF